MTTKRKAKQPQAVDTALQITERVSMEDISELGERLEQLTVSARNTVFKPERSKPAPKFSIAQLAKLCNIAPQYVSRLLSQAEKKGLPPGSKDYPRDESGEPNTEAAMKHFFTLADARQWIQHFSKAPTEKPEGSRAATITVGNFKGGVGKTILAVSLAQGLSLKGYKVLLIDFDPQGSATSLFGLAPNRIQESETVLPLMAPLDVEYARPTLQESIMPTYWDGIDLVPGSHTLFTGEFWLPLRQMDAQKPGSKEPGFQFYDVLNRALDAGIRDHYDYIIIDTPPALSYMTMTTFWASDALLLPLPPDQLDFVSSAQFWSMLSDLSTGTTGTHKDYAWVGAVASKVDRQNLNTPLVLNLMKQGYQGRLLSSEIPETAAVRVGGISFSTVYDIGKYIGSQRTYDRARAAYDDLVNEVDFLTWSTLWANAGEQA